ncbi:hypothetical protein V5799_002275 [Amblyomma americanum]|uniref:ISXO2-like transposase domain-containing protein n=1 Tax=Amblyomma americanum TaxID=6943 RepID=A0AAQ4CXN4_AMBAM
MQNSEISKQACTDWTNYIREVCCADLSEQPPMGGPGEVVQVDECLMRGKRKANRGRLLAGDNVPPHRQNNYGGVVDRGPWVFGMIWEATKELRPFKVDRRDAATLGAIIAANVQPRTTIVSDEWAAYQCVPGLLDSNGVNMNLSHNTVNHSQFFAQPVTGAHTQNTGSSWQKARLIRSGRKPTPQLTGVLHWAAVVAFHQWEIGSAAMTLSFD